MAPGDLDRYAAKILGISIFLGVSLQEGEVSSGNTACFRARRGPGDRDLDRKILGISSVLGV